MSHDGNERVEHIKIIITSVQKVYNVIPNLYRSLSTIQVGVIIKSGNIWILSSSYVLHGVCA